MTIPAMADKPFALIDARIEECKNLMINGSCGGTTPEDCFIRYKVQVALYKELMRFRESLVEAFNDDEEDEKETK